MQTIKDFIGNFSEEDLKKNFYSELKDQKFKNLRNLINLDDKDLFNYTYLLKDSALEYDNCKNCKGLEYCKNNMPGYVYFPHIINGNLKFDYDSCKYKNKEIEDTKYYKNVTMFKVPENLRKASIKDIYTDDKSRVEIVKFIIKYIDNYLDGKKEKGLYLSGNFGSGKTYLICSLFNELAKNNVKSYVVYFPELLRKLKASFNEESFDDNFEYLKTVPLLLIDDIGAENVTSWSRDEVLGTLLQYRMDANLPTFFTSNLTIDELEVHLSIAGAKIDKVKARRIIERIKYLSSEMKLIGINRRS